MRLKKNRLKKYNLFQKTSIKNTEGTLTKSFELSGTFEAEPFEVNSRYQIELYGQRAAKMLNLNTQSNLEFTEGDGVGVNSSTPNYQIISIDTFTFHKRILIESIH